MFVLIYPAIAVVIVFSNILFTLRVLNELSVANNKSIKDCLFKNFSITATRIETDSKGQTEPLAPNNTTEGKAKNRRVVFVRI
jgi:hypothetical protein